MRCSAADSSKEHGIACSDLATSCMSLKVAIRSPFIRDAARGTLDCRTARSARPFIIQATCRARDGRSYPKRTSSVGPVVFEGKDWRGHNAVHRDG